MSLKKINLSFRMLAACVFMACLFSLAACNGDSAKTSLGAEQNGVASVTEAQQVDSQLNTAKQEIVANVDAEYVGSEKCETCHQSQTDDWQGSHHDLAMQEPNADTVLGDFNNTRFNYFGTESSFYKNDGQFYVTTDGPSGELREYPIAYTFGVYPLQQYLIEFPGGKLQALNVVWDTRSKEEGGQRWFHLYPNEHIKHDDELHWTGINQNWNYMCADCHSTNLQKNYSAETNTYDTTWSEIDVGCEACHGPASNHLAWARAGEKNTFDNRGFSHTFDERQDMAWAIDPATGNAKRSHPKTGNKEIETCAACHSRRSTAHGNTRPGEPLLDNFRISLLEDSLYHADGQINGEVYVYGSFVQSKMYHAGVTCSDCHQPHSLELRAEGNQVCAQCHLTTQYESQAHHLHTNNSAGSQCVDCHMPAKNFMVVDARNDHGFRIPRPDLSVSLGVPNACNQCHKDKSNEWAANTLRENFGPRDTHHYARALTAGRRGDSQAEVMLAGVIVDESLPAIIRATAVTLMPRYLSNESAQVLRMVAQSDEPLLGLALASVAEQIPVQYRAAFAVPLLYDNSRITRGLAAQSLAGISLEQFPAEVRDKYQSAITEYLASENFNADRPESLTNLADFYQRNNVAPQAEKLYRDAIDIAAYYTPAYVNLADLYRVQGDELRVQEVLRQAMPNVRDQATIQHAMGLSLVRQQKLPEALEYLRSAAEDPATSARYQYVYAVGLHTNGQTEAALAVTEKALQQFNDNSLRQLQQQLENELEQSGSN